MLTGLLVDYNNMIIFLKYRLIYFLISTIVIGSGIFSIIRWGFSYSIDFVGGTNIEYELNKKVDTGEVEKLLAEDKLNADLVSSDNNKLYLRLKPISDKEEVKLLLSKIKDE